jgi:ferredoxin
MKICVDYELCMGHAVCEGLDPEVFRLGEDAFTRLLIEDPGEDKRELMEDAVAQCPTGALSIQD